MKRAQLAVAVAAVVLGVLAATLVLAGCGDDSKTADPFVGTWRETGVTSGTPLVIAETQGGYLGNFAFSGGTEPASPRPTLSVPLTREGDKLTGTFDGPLGTVAVEIVWQPETGKLTWSNTAPGGKMTTPMEMTKVSGSTAIPSQSP